MRPAGRAPVGVPPVTVSVIVPSSAVALPDGHRVLRRCLEALERNAGWGDYEVLVVDNVMWGDGARQVLREAAAKGCRVLPYPYKFHRSRVSNFAARMARGDYLLFLDSDALAGENLVARLLEAVRTSPGVKAAGARIVDAQRVSRQAAGFERRGGGFVPGGTADLLPGTVVEREALPLCCLLVERRAFEAVGGFDERYRLYNADIDLCLRLRLAGWRSVVAADAYVLHYGSLTRGPFTHLLYPRIQDDRVLEDVWLSPDGAKSREGGPILVIKLMTLGDAVMVTPTLRALRRARPGSPIVLATCRAWREVFEGNPAVDELIAVDPPDSRLAPLHLYYDAVTAELLARRRWADVIQLNCLDFFPEYRRTGLHLRDFYAEIAGVHPLKDPRYAIPVSPRDRAAVAALPALAQGGKTICIHTAGGWSLKNWPPGKWARFAARMRALYGSKVILVGAPGEGIDSPDIVDLSGKLGIKELAALLERADLFVGLDSGPMHVASAANAPVVALFGPTHARVGAPNCDSFIAVQAPASCDVPCGLKSCTRGGGCMDSISVETVVRASRRLLERAGSLREEWVGEEPAQMLFADWEWHTCRAAPAAAEQGSPDPAACCAEERAGAPLVSRRHRTVVFQARGNAFDLPGGDTEVMRHLEKHLARLGFRVTYSCDPGDSLDDADLVHVFNFETPFAVNAARRRRPYVVTPMYEDLNAYYLKSMAACAWLGNHPWRALSANGDWGAAMGRIAGGTVPADFHFAAAAAWAILASGPSEKARIRRDFPEAGPVVVVRVGFDAPEDPARVSAHDFAERYGLEDFILCVGRLESRKNQLMLLHALRDDKTPVVLVGSRTVQPEYEAWCRSVSRAGPTLVLGRLPRRMLFSAYRAARVHVLPSWYELPGLVSLEAAWFGCPVVATRWGTAAEYLGDAAVYCEPDDPASIRGAVSEAIGRPPGSAWKKRLARLAWSRQAERVAAVYERVLAKAATMAGARRLARQAEAGEEEARYLAIKSQAVDAARRHPGQVLAVLSSLGPRARRDPDVRFAEGLAHLVLGRLAEAEGCFAEVLAMRPWYDVRCALLLSTVLLRRRRPGAAAKVLEAALAAHPFAADGAVALLLGRLEEALAGCGQTDKAGEAKRHRLALERYLGPLGGGSAL